MKKWIAVFVLLLFSGCSTNVNLEQRTKIGTHCPLTYKVTTEVWVEKRFLGLGFILTTDIINLEYYETRWGVLPESLETIQIIEYVKGRAWADSVEICLESLGSQ